MAWVLPTKREKERPHLVVRRGRLAIARRVSYKTTWHTCNMGHEHGVNCVSGYHYVILEIVTPQGYYIEWPGIGTLSWAIGRLLKGV